jgi:Ca-activated chloride channel family protein
MTVDVGRLQQTIESFLKPEGATSLYDAIFDALTYLKPFQGRRVIVIVSDGRDTTSRDEHDFEGTLKRSQSDECQIYVVQTGVYDNANVARPGGRATHAGIRRAKPAAPRTFPEASKTLDKAFAQISADLAQQYVLSYYPDMDKRDGKYHLITVKVKAPANSRVRARRGFLVKSRDNT